MRYSVKAGRSSACRMPSSCHCWSVSAAALVAPRPLGLRRHVDPHDVGGDGGWPAPRARCCGGRRRAAPRRRRGPPARCRSADRRRARSGARTSRLACRHGSIQPVTSPLAAGAPVICDLDGVIWLSLHAIAGSADAIARLRASGHRVLFVTNNSSLMREDVEAALEKVGVPAVGDVLTLGDGGGTAGRGRGAGGRGRGPRHPAGPGRQGCGDRGGRSRGCGARRLHPRLRLRRPTPRQRRGPGRGPAHRHQ